MSTNPRALDGQVSRSLLRSSTLVHAEMFLSQGLCCTILQIIHCIALYYTVRSACEKGEKGESIELIEWEQRTS